MTIGGDIVEIIEKTGLNEPPLNFIISELILRLGKNNYRDFKVEEENEIKIDGIGRKLAPGDRVVIFKSLDD